MYPIKLIPKYHERIWGGDNLNKLFGRQLPNDKIGESWEICSHKNGMSVVANGNLAGKTIEEVISIYKEEVLGKKYIGNSCTFPLMIKILDANDKLSIQVHPQDDYAYRVEQESGKMEAWYVAAAKENAQIVYGLKEGITKEVFMEAVEQNKILGTLRYVPVKTGDMIFVPAGMVHALFEGIVVYEVQQNSDTTYRVYDFDRVDAEGKVRELHIDKAVDVIRFEEQAPVDFNTAMVECPSFCMEKLIVNGEKVDDTDDNFIIYCVIDGKGEVCYQDYALTLAPGETVLIPACLDSVTLKGQVTLLRIQQ